MIKALIFSLILCPFIIFGQQESGPSTYKHSLAYFGNTFINPGVAYSLEKQLWNSFKPSSKYGFFGNNIINLNGTAGYYWDPFSHSAFLNYYELNLRQYFGRRLGIQFGAGLGYQLNFTSENYVFDDNFNVNKKGVRTRAYFAPEISSAFVLSNRNQTRSIISKVTCLLLVPYNNIFLPVINYELHYQF